MIKIIKESYPYYVIQDDNLINQYAVFLKTDAGFYQQISKWYFRKGNAIRQYHNYLTKATQTILEHKALIRR